MLNMYQLWLDDLYPRAKFADALAIIEKVGHTKRMQVDRKAWMDEGKAKPATTGDDDDDDDGSEANVPHDVSMQDREEIRKEQELEGNVAGLQSRSAAQQSKSQLHPAIEEPDEDELDALLADNAAPDALVPGPLPRQSAPIEDDPFADEMEAMKGMEDMW